ncbi:MAG: hypothetical protein ACYCSS_09790 [Sulfuriferula sp.]
MDSDKENKLLYGEIFKQINSSFNRCFWPKAPRCSAKAIRAHSIQNSGVLDLLCENDHVIMPKTGINIDAGPFLKFEKIGRNKATTFTGLCDEHDCRLFAPIDKRPFDPAETEQLFLLAYRSVLRELHTKMKAAVDVQSQYRRAVELGKFDPDVVDVPMMLATMAISESYSFYRYKFAFDQIYANGTYKDVLHRIELVENIAPSIAVSTTYSYIDNMKTLEHRTAPKCVSLNIFPSNSGVYVIFSYLKGHEKYVIPYLDRIFEATSQYKLYLISKLVLMYCENFVMSPKFFRNIPESAKSAMEEYFMANIFGDKRDCENPALYLFN